MRMFEEIKKIGICLQAGEVQYMLLQFVVHYPPEKFEKLGRIAMSCMILGQHLVQPFPLQAVFKQEAFCELVQLLRRLPDEVLRPFLDEIFGHQDVPGYSLDSSFHRPDWEGVQATIFLIRDGFLNELYDRIEGVFDCFIIRTPAIDG